MVIVGSGLAGLGCAYRLWHGHGLRSEVYEYNPHRIGGRVQTLRGFFDAGQYAEQHGETLLASRVVGGFSVLSFLISIAGIYAVMAFLVARRTREIGIRVAVGASRADILALVLSQGARMAAFGVVIGILGAFSLTRLMTKLLFGVTAADPVTFAGVVALMIAVVFLACLIPARRAMRVDPMVALRHD